MNRTALFIAIGYVGLALVSAGIYVAATAKFVDYSQTQLVFTAGRIADGTFTRMSDRWTVTLQWRFDNRGHLPVTVGSLLFEVAVDNTSDSRAWSDPGKIAEEYTQPLSFFLDRFTGLVVAPGSTLDRPFTFNVTDPANIAKIAPSQDGKFYVVVLGGQMVYFISDVSERHIQGVSPSYVGV